MAPRRGRGAGRRGRSWSSSGHAAPWSAGAGPAGSSRAAAPCWSWSRSRRGRRGGWDQCDPGTPSIAGAAALRPDDRVRWRSASFFITELLVVDERPDHTIVDAQAPIVQLGNQSAQGEVALLAALQQPVPILTDQLLGSMSAHLASRHAPGLAIPVDPLDRRADRHAEAGRGLVTRQAVTLDCLNHPLAKIH